VRVGKLGPSGPRASRVFPGHAHRRMVLGMGDRHEQSGEQQVAGEHCRAITGDYGRSIAGRMGVALSGDYGFAMAGDHGFAVAGEHGTAISGAHGFSIAGYEGYASSGPGGIITIEGRDESGHTYSVSADIDDVNGPSSDTLYRLEDHRFVLVQSVLVEEGVQ